MNYTIATQKPQKLSVLIQKNNLSLRLPCGGNSRCGRCTVTVTGDISPLSEKERMLLSENDIKNNVRLACHTTVYSVCTIIADDDKLTSHPSDFAAIDVGTTSIEALYDDGIKLKLENPQRMYGADVISRIESARNHYSDLRSCILEKLKVILSGCRTAVITGNTAMLSIIAGKSVEGLASYPFTPEALFGSNDVIEKTTVYYPPCADAFIGADIICGVISSGITESSAPAMLCDVGTNTEMALWDGKQLYFASAPSGPAFEGGNISYGMSASYGAIYRVYKDGYKLCFDTIGDSYPVGICGSGLVDAVSFMKSSGILSKSGRIMEYGHRYPNLVTSKNSETAFRLGSSDVIITQSDIRNFQMAKAAVFTGICILMEKAKISNIRLLAGGQFGNHLNIENAVISGIFPKGDFQFAGNCALSGASLMKTEKYRRLAKKLVAEATVIKFHETDGFAQKLTENMNFV